MDSNFEPLGFSDLTEDEGLLIVIYRDWQKRAPYLAIGEHAIARLLERDKFRAVLDDIFAIFLRVRDEEDCVLTDSPVLSFDEETLLTRVSDLLNRLPVRISKPDRISIRQACDIPRSGRDNLVVKTNGAYWRIANHQVFAAPSGF